MVDVRTITEQSHGLTVSDTRTPADMGPGNKNKSFLVLFFKKEHFFFF
jgi:hypothetical protein